MMILHFTLTETKYILHISPSLVHGKSHKQKKSIHKHCAGTYTKILVISTELCAPKNLELFN